MVTDRSTLIQLCVIDLVRTAPMVQHFIFMSLSTSCIVRDRDVAGTPQWAVARQPTPPPVKEVMPQHDTIGRISRYEPFKN